MKNQNINPEILKKALKIALSTGADLADIFIEKNFKNVILSDDRKIKTALSVNQGIGIRIVKGEETYYGITDSFKEHDIYNLAEFLKNSFALKNNPGKILNLTSKKPKQNFIIKVNPKDLETLKKIEIVKIAEETAWSGDARIKQAVIRYFDEIREITLATSLDNSIINQVLGGTSFSCSVYAGDSNDLHIGSKGRAFYAGIEALKGENSPENIAKFAKKKALILLKAKDSCCGSCPVVFSRGENGVLFHESCGHGLEADLVEKGSIFSGKMGQKVASPLVTIVDNAALPGFPGSFAFDDEGTFSQKTIMIKEGVLVNYLQSFLTAKKQGLRLTGNARRESFAYPPIPRMTNTYIEKGKTNPKDIIENTKFGVYVEDCGGGGQVDVVTGQFVSSVSLGYLIEKGKLTYPIKGCTLTSSGIEVLNNIDLVGNDLEITPTSGRCGKWQAVPVGVGMPTVRVGSLIVGGKGEIIC
ncbi:MAG: TldD/PmbA family protein [Armatimonadetes bacterium]|nr:TldD/PmbA family protein [Armatimonadota bacterium]